MHTEVIKGERPRQSNLWNQGMKIVIHCLIDIPAIKMYQLSGMVACVLRSAERCTIMYLAGVGSYLERCTQGGRFLQKMLSMHLES